MRRIGLALVLVVVACKKPKKEVVAEPPPGPPKVGHSVTKVHGSGEEPEGSAGSDTAGSGVATGEPQDARTVGGDTSGAYRDQTGRVHGPGGPVYMGRGVDCDAAHDHCLREPVWFSVGNIEPGKLYRAVPVYTLEDKWWTWRGEQDTPIKLYRTELAKKAPPAGTPIIFFSAETSSTKWADSEYEAMTSSRWEAGVVEAASGENVRVKGWGDTPLDTVRTIAEQKAP